MKIILASKSPRRKMILEKLGLSFEVVPSRFDESSIRIRNPERLVTALAEKKAEAVAGEQDDSVVIGSDAAVVIDSMILGQPKSKGEAAEMLRLLSGKTHRVCCGICVICTANGKKETALDVSEVTFRHLSEMDIQSYIGTGMPMDKAGSYSIIDEISSGFVSSYAGSFTGIIGLSVERLVPILKGCGIAVDMNKYAALQAGIRAWL